MSADEVADRVVGEVGDGYAYCVVNFANPDMVGHTGSIPATIAAVETADRCLGRVVARVGELGGVCLVTADHGNAEQMLEPDGVSPHTAHTTNPVPLVVTAHGIGLSSGGELADLAPTALDLLGLRHPRCDDRKQPRKSFVSQERSAEDGAILGFLVAPTARSFGSAQGPARR